jgi:16S rRNA (guanine(966)-N(2))-methyltransferase RsmD
MRVISGRAKGVVLKTPDGMLTRPTSDRVKEAMFSIIQFDLPGAKVLDLFGGSGQLGIEAISRGASAAVFVDSREEACRLIRSNLLKAKMEEQGKVIRSDYADYLKRCKEKFRIIFLDPPYAEVFLEKSLNTEFFISFISPLPHTNRSWQMPQQYHSPTPSRPGW